MSLFSRLFGPQKTKSPSPKSPNKISFDDLKFINKDLRKMINDVIIGSNTDKVNDFVGKLAAYKARKNPMYQLYMLIGDGLYNWYGTTINMPIKLGAESKQFLMSLSTEDQAYFNKRYLQSKYRVGRKDGKLEQFFKHMFVLSQLQHIVDNISKKNNPYESCESIMQESDKPNTAYYRTLFKLMDKCERLVRNRLSTYTIAQIRQLQISFIKLVRHYRVAELADTYMGANVL